MLDKLNDLLMLLCRLISARKLYFAGHAKVVELSDDFLHRLREFCDSTDTSKLFIGVVNGSIVYEGKSLIGPSVLGKQLLQFAANLNCGGISFARDTPADELSIFLDLTSDLDRPLQSFVQARELLNGRGVGSIEIAQHYRDPGTALPRDKRTVWQGQDPSTTIQSPTLIYQALFDVVGQAHEDAGHGGVLDLQTTRSVSEYMLQFTRENFSDLLQHVHYPDHDSYTVGHSVRVAALCVYFANCFEWDKEQILAFGTAGLLHDVGKSKIPNEILNKPGKLTQQEFSIMSAHSRLGAEILMAQKDSSELEIAAAWGHHVRNDGGGYPQMPAWAVRHPMTALLQICDVFEALTASRPYKPALTPHMAYGVMLRDRESFHPNLLASFMSVVGLYPPGNAVQLSDGSRAIVTAAGSQIDKPRVKITHSRQGTPVSESDRRTVDLGAASSRRLSVQRLIPVESL